MSDDIDGIQDPIHHMSRRTFCEPVRGFAGAWMALRARNPFPRGLATSDPQSTCPRPRPGPKRARGVWAGSLRATGSRARETTCGRERKKCRRAKTTRLYIVIQGSPLGCVWREFPGVRQVEKGHAGNTAVATAYLCWVKHCHRSGRTGVPADYCY